MSQNRLTFAQLREAADLKYQKLEIEVSKGVVTVLQSPLRLSKERRKQIADLIEQLQAVADAEEDDAQDGEEIQGMYSEFLLAVGDENTQDLLNVVADDLGLLITLFENYQECVSLGEASPSPS